MNTTIVTVREGEARVALATGAQQALPGQTVTVNGPDPVAADVRNGIGEDGFDVWSANRDRYYEPDGSAAYVSQQMVGYADLDQHGTWQQYPDYGAVWFPNAVAPDWAPYSDGYWTNVGDWGYTWVDYAPWGYAPFHYGRWILVGGRWAWVPGGYVRRPVWAPALVGFVGSGVSISIGGPVVGWYPLAPWHRYQPHYRHSPTYVTWGATSLPSMRLAAGSWASTPIKCLTWSGRTIGWDQSGKGQSNNAARRSRPCGRTSS